MHTHTYGEKKPCVVKSHPLNTLIEPNTQMSHAARCLNKHSAVNTTNAQSRRSLAQSLVVNLNCSNERERGRTCHHRQQKGLSFISFACQTTCYLLHCLLQKSVVVRPACLLGISRARRRETKGRGNSFSFTHGRVLLPTQARL